MNSKRIRRKQCGAYNRGQGNKRKADILVVTTEVLRNMIHEDPEKVEDIKYIILDEIHYINNESRGTVWEEVIIFKPKNTKIIGLSATIPNIHELSDWISSVHQEKVKRVYYPKRIVPQKHCYFDRKLKRASYKDVIKTTYPFRTLQMKCIKTPMLTL